jgi:hypothetical protein
VISCVTTALQLADSAMAPWTRTMVEVGSDLDSDMVFLPIDLDGGRDDRAGPPARGG